MDLKYWMLLVGATGALYTLYLAFFQRDWPERRRAERRGEESPEALPPGVEAERRRPPDRRDT